MAWLVRVYRLANLLSFDVALGAACSALFFAKILKVHILPYGIVALTLTVWIIYTVDHLLDAKMVKTPAATRRHKFHQHYYHLLKWSVIAAMMVDGVMLFFIRKPVLLGGIVLAGFVAVYLLVQRYVKFIKEIFISLMYTGGVLLPSFSVTHYSINDLPWMLIMQFAITALINLLLFSWFDYESDLKDGASSLATVVGRKYTLICITILFVVLVCLTPLTVFREASYVILSMGLILMIILVGHRFFRWEDRFRLLGDAVFFIPVLYILL